MLKENELRIGNYLYDAIGNIGSVVISGNSFVLSTEDRGYVSLQECTPIPLTPEILEKCGFVITDKINEVYQTKFNWHPKAKDDYLYVLPYDSSSWQFGVGKYSYNNEHSTTIIRIGLEYLHQLQNLYFALTGTELEINL